MSSAGVWFKETGMKAVIDRLAATGQLPQKAVTKAAGKGANVTRKAVKGEVPVGETGNLKRSIIRHGERSRLRGKKVYDVYFDPGMNELLQKPVKNPGAAGSKATKNGHAYYPASMEFGFLTRSKGGGLSYVPGYHFMRQGAEESSAAAKETMTQTLIAELDKTWGK